MWPWAEGTILICFWQTTWVIDPTMSPARREGVGGQRSGPGNVSHLPTTGHFGTYLIFFVMLGFFLWGFGCLERLHSLSTKHLCTVKSSQLPFLYQWNRFSGAFLSIICQDRQRQQSTRTPSTAQASLLKPRNEFSVLSVSAAGLCF